jgi:Spx/MgsR family transcriptional regulator
MIKIYGIKNCNSVKKALNFLENEKINFEFHDYKKLGIDEKTMQNFIKKFGLEKVLNKKGTTFKKLSEIQQKESKNEEKATELMQKNTSLIKRPIIIGKNFELIGFNEEEYAVIFNKN